MNVKANNLGYRELSRLGNFLNTCGESQILIDFINDLIAHDMNFYISYDLRSDEPFIAVPNIINNKVLFYENFYESDFE